MTRVLLPTFAALILSAGLSVADPEVVVSYPSGVPRIEIAGSYPRSTYTVWRRLPADPLDVPLTHGDVLCLGSCFAFDPAADPGQTYLYRFDLVLDDGSRVTFGPYAVTISSTLAARVRARLSPSPGVGTARDELFLGGGGGPLEADARLFDLQGRAVATLHRGPLARGLTTLAWDGRGDHGGMLPSGLYLLRFSSPLGTTVTRVLRTR